MRERKMRHQNAGVENAGLENAKEKWNIASILSSVHAGYYSRRAVFGNRRRFRRQPLNWATVAVFGDSRRFR